MLQSYWSLSFQGLLYSVKVSPLFLVSLHKYETYKETKSIYNLRVSYCL